MLCFFYPQGFDSKSIPSSWNAGPKLFCFCNPGILCETRKVGIAISQHISRKPGFGVDFFSLEVFPVND